MSITHTLRVFALYLSAALAAQQLPMQMSSPLTGEISGLSAGAENRYQLEIRPVSAGGAPQPPERAIIDMAGRFHMTRVSPGQYEFLLIGPDHQLIGRQLATVGDYTAPLQLRFPETQQRDGRIPPGSGVQVPLARLRHKVPRTAVKAFRKAHDHKNHGRTLEAEKCFRQAIAADPLFVEAYNDLGVLYFVSRRYPESLQVLESARAIDPNLAPVLANLSAALLALHRPAEAEPLARRAVVAGGARARSRYLLGMSRAAQNKFDAETRELLEESVREIPAAHLALAQLYRAQGDFASARRHQGMFDSLR